MLTSPILAQAAPGGDFFIQFLPFVAIFAIMYFLIIRPQQKRLHEHRAMVEGVRRGDTVVTGGGIVGKIVKADDGPELQVEIAEGVRVKVMRGTLSEVRSKGEAPAKVKAE